MNITLHTLGNILGGLGNFHQFPDEEINKIRTDSRVIEKGDVFVCLPGERFDGHNFAQDALSRGARAIVADRSMPQIEDSCAVIIVRDTYHALREMASYFRKNFKGKVIGITGSCGKTSVKELIYSILSTHYKVGKNFKNWNNLVGVPLSIFDFKGNEDFWVLEAGINQKGEMDLLGEMINPDVVIIHNIGPVHLEGLGSLEGVAEEKSKFIEHLTTGGFALINADYPLLVDKAEQKRGPLILFGDSTPYKCSFVGYEQDFKGIFRLSFEGIQEKVCLPVGGSIFEENLSAACLCAWKLGLDFEKIKQGLSKVTLPEHRIHFFKVGRLLVVDDCYNANPVSMSRIIKDIKKLRNNGFFIAILGDMLELGQDAPSHHFELGRLVGEAGVDVLIYKGNFFDEVTKGLKATKAQSRIYPVTGIREFELLWKEIAPEEGIVLIKASRGMRLDVFLSVIKEGTT